MARIFEDLSNLYLFDLKNQGVIIEGSLVGVNEDFQTSTAKVSIAVGNEIKEKFISIYKQGDNFTWKFFIQSDKVHLYDFSNSGWHYPSFSKRVVAPIQLALQYPAIEVWFRLNDLPIVSEQGTLYCYCNIILEEHQILINGLAGVVTVENNPN